MKEILYTKPTYNETNLTDSFPASEFICTKLIGRHFGMVLTHWQESKAVFFGGGV